MVAGRLRALRRGARRDQPRRAGRRARCHDRARVQPPGPRSTRSARRRAGSSVEAEEAERTALARRFGLVAIDRLAAELALSRDGDEVAVDGTLSAQVTQACVATGEPLAAEIEAPFDLALPPAARSRRRRRGDRARRERAGRRLLRWRRRSTSAKRSPRRWRSTSTPIPARPAPRRRSRPRA